MLAKHIYENGGDDHSANNNNNNINNKSSAMTLKELKIAHRNQTILTGGSGSSNCDDDIPFDFGAVVTAGATRATINSKTIIVNEPMDRDIEMETIVESESTMTTQQTKPAIRPTTLNIPGGTTIDFFFYKLLAKKILFT